MLHSYITCCDAHDSALPLEETLNGLGHRKRFFRSEWLLGGRPYTDVINPTLRSKKLHSTTQSVRFFPCRTSLSARSLPVVILRSQDRDRRPTTIVRHLLRRANSRISSLTLFCSPAGSENWVVRDVAGRPVFRSLVRAQFKVGSALFLAAMIHCCCSVLSCVSSRLSFSGSSTPPNSSNIGGNGGRK